VPLNALAMARIAPNKIPNATGLYTLVRQLGGSVGIAIAATQYTHMQATYTADISLHVSQLDSNTQTYISQMQQMLLKNGSAAAEVQQKVYNLLEGQITAQASMISFEHLFMLFSFALIIAMPLLLLMPTARNIGQQGGGH